MDRCTTLRAAQPVTPIPVDRPPFPLPRNVEVPIYFTIQPGGAYVSTPGPGPRGAWLVYPNYTQQWAGKRMQFFHYDPNERDWYVYGLGTVTPDRRQVVPDARTRVYEFTGAMINGGGTPPADGPPPGDCCRSDGDPVDLATGLFTLEETDLTLPDVLPITLTRTYRQRDLEVRPFGVGMTHPYAMFLWSEHQYTEADVILPDGGRVHFIRTSAGTSFIDAVFEHVERPDPPPGEVATAATPTAFYRSVMRWNTNGWDLTLKDGTVYVFGENAPLQAIRDRYGNQITVAHENGQSGKVTRVTSPDGRWIAFTYTGSVITQVTDNSGRTWTYGYDAVSNLTSVTDPETHVTSYTYDSDHRMVTVKPPNLQGTPTNLVTNEYTTSADAPTPAGWVKKQTHADGGVYQFAYTVSNGRSTQTDVTDPRGYVRRVVMNADGYTISDTRGFGLAEAQTAMSERSGSSNFVATSADTLAGQLVKTVYVRNEFGNVMSFTRCPAGQDPCTDGNPNSLTTRYTYDPRFQQVATVTDPLNHTTTYGYDDAGNLTSVTDPLQHETTFEYNARGQLTSATDALQHTTRFGYSGGDLIATTDPLMRVTRRFIDAGGRLLSVTDPLGQITRYTYDRNNHVLSMTDALGRQTGFTYFPDGQLQTVTDANQHTTSYTYDVMGRMASRTDPLQRAETFSYDLHGNPRIWVDRKGQITTRTYDVRDRLQQVEYGDGSTITYTYDERDRISQLDDSASNASIVRTFDDFDRLLSETTPQGTVGYSYDGASRRTKLMRTGQPDIVYDYDNADRLTSVTRDTLTVVMTYDNANRRATTTLPNGIVTEYGYDDSNQITLITYRYGTTTLGDLGYAYDGAGRRTILGGTWARTGLPSAVTAATYDAANQLTVWGTETRQYDANGSLASDGLTSYSWDARQRLSGTSGASAKMFAYDAIGRRVSATIDGASASYLYDGANHLSKTANSDAVQFLSGPALDEWFARIDSSGTKVFLRDALGSTVALANSVGEVTDVYTYEPFGRSIAQGSTTNAEGFTGREQDDPESYYYRARYYRPSEGRFLSEDAIRLAPDASLYAYVGGDPVSRIDPTGRLQGPVPLPGVGAGATAGAAAGGGLAAGLAAAGVNALVAFDVWIIQRDIDLLRQLCEAYGYCTPTPRKCEKRPPTLGRCLDACEGGLPLREAFCRSIADPQLAARCWSHRFDSETSCRNWCLGEFGK